MSAMSAPRYSENARPAHTLSCLPGVLAHDAGDDQLARLERTAGDFRQPPVGDARDDLARLRLAVDQHVHRAPELARRHGIVVAAPLFRSLVRSLAHPLPLTAALARIAPGGGIVARIAGGAPHRDRREALARLGPEAQRRVGHGEHVHAPV